MTDLKVLGKRAVRCPKCQGRMAIEIIVASRGEYRHRCGYILSEHDVERVKHYMINRY